MSRRQETQGRRQEQDSSLPDLEVKQVGNCQKRKKWFKIPNTRVYNSISPPPDDQPLQVSVGPVSPSWLEKNSSKIQDWVEDVEQGDVRDHHRSEAVRQHFLTYVNGASSTSHIAIELDMQKCC